MPKFDSSASERGRKRWEDMSSEEREARIAFLTGMWENPRARGLLSQTMTELWDEYKSTSRYRELLKKMTEAASHD